MIIFNKKLQNIVKIRKKAQKSGFFYIASHKNRKNRARNHKTTAYHYPKAHQLHTYRLKEITRTNKKLKQIFKIKNKLYSLNP